MTDAGGANAKLCQAVNANTENLLWISLDDKQKPLNVST